MPRAVTPQTVVCSVKRAHRRYCCPDRADSGSNVLLITIRDRRRRPASAALASRQGFRRTLCCFRLTHTHTHTHTNTQMGTHAQGLSLSSFIKVPDGVHKQTDVFSDSAEAMYPPYECFFYYLSSSSPRMHHEHTCALDELVYFPWVQCDHKCAVITVRMLPEWFCEWKTEPEQQ